MAKHDRITIRVATGPDIVMVARGSGFTVALKTDRDWVTIEELNGARRPEPVREARVAVGSVVSIVRDRVGDQAGDSAKKAIRHRAVTT